MSETSPASAARFRVPGLKSQVTRELLKRALLIGVVASALVSTYQGVRHHQQRQETLRHHFSAIRDHVAPALVESLWAFNEAQTKAQLQGLTHEQDVSAVMLKQPGLPDRRYSRAPLSDQLLTLEVPLERVEDGKTYPLATLWLVHDLVQDQHQTLREIGLNTLGNGVVLLLVILISLATYHKFVQQRLAVIVDELSRTGPEDLLQTARRQATAPVIRDEIDELAQAIVQLKASGGTALDLLEQQNKALQTTLDELTQAKVLLRAVIDTAPVRIFWKNCQSQYLGCNRLFAQDAGLASPEALVGKSDEDLCWVQQAPAYRADDQAIMASGVAHIGYEEMLTLPDGQTTCLRTSKAPMLDNTGQPIGIVGIYEDVTAYKEAEKKLAEQLQELLRWQDLMLDREDRILELKGEVNALLAQAQQAPRYETTLPPSPQATA